VDGVWQFELDGSTHFKSDGTDGINSVGATLLVCTDGKVARPEKYMQAPAAQAAAPQPASQ
jgi:hypothetical protein